MDEVESALKLMVGYTVLLKGAPGTGKTTYAMTLLERLCQGEAKGAYISTRIDPTALYNQFPDLESRVPVKNVIDATQSEFSEAESQVIYEDLTSFLRSVYSVVAEEDVTILIIDSWDAVSFQVGKKNQDLEKLETSMLDISRKTKTHLILISECTGEERLDYLVDGILRLEKEQIDDRVVRKGFIDKMRGFQVPRSNYPYTLEGGKFTHFVTPGSGLGSGRHRVIKKEELSPGYYSTGMEDMDRIIGGYPEGGFVLLEIADDSISWSYRSVLFHTIAEFLLNDRGVIYLPEDGSYSSSVKKLLSDYVSEDVLDKNLWMPTISESKDTGLIHLKGETELLNEYLTKHLEAYKGQKKPVLHVLGLTRLNAYSEDDIRGTLSEMVSWVRTTKDVLIGVLKPSAKLKNELCEMADVHLRFIPINGTLNIYGIKPHTALYNISPLPSREGAGEKKEENHQLKFTPFV
ncbi:MAG: gas vesicle protein GvpD P-loop domain-containing protein [Halobacteriota archaeon]